jgi:hypothetical protein
MSQVQSELRPAVGARPRWWFLVTPRWLGWHLFAVVATWGMLWLGDWQLHRALSGNALSWAYTFEWPIFAVLGLGFWAKTIVDEWKARGPEALAAAREDSGTAGDAIALSLPRRPAPPADGSELDEDDPELVAYNAYLARLNSQVKGHGRWHGLR